MSFAEPLLEARGARISVDGAVALAGLDLVTRGARVMLVGGADALLSALCGAPSSFDHGDADPFVASITGGELFVLGQDASKREHRSLCGCAPLAPPLPPRWTVQEYLIWSARLAGAKPRAARSLAEAAIAQLAMTAMVKRRLRTLHNTEQRALLIAAAAVAQPRVIVMQNPFADLDTTEAVLVMGAVARAAQDRGVIISVDRIRLGHPSGEMARTATDICVFRNGGLVLHADAAALLTEGRVYELTVRDNVDALRDALARRGVELRGGPIGFSVTLPDDMGPAQVLSAAAEARAPVTRCIPLIT